MIILKRLAGRIGVTVALLFGIVALVESLDTWRFQHLSSIGGPLLGGLAIALNSARWSLNTLPVTLLIGAIVGLLDLQARREITVINAAGFSIWRMVRAPLLAVAVLGLALSAVGDAALVTMMRSLSVSLPQANAGSALWLKQRGDGSDYVLVAQHPLPGGVVLDEVTFFLPDALGGPRVRSQRAELDDGAWVIANGVRFAADKPPTRVAGLRIPTESTPGDMGASLASPGDLTMLELMQIESLDLSDPRLGAGVQMRLARLLALPLTLAASLLLAFAFTAGYRRTNKYGATVLYGIVLGFVVYVVTEMAAMAGSAGILEPTFAAVAPAFVAFVIGTTVLLYKEDGRR